MKRIIVLSGGGCKGPILSEALLSLETKIGKRLHEVTDLFVGTSVGAIIGSIYANGSLSASQTNTVFIDTLPKVFKKQFRWPGQPKYDRKPVRDAFKVAIGEPLMRDCRTKFICTSVNCCDSRTHYFKSDEVKDGSIPIIDVVERSFAAPLFFGALKDVQGSALWIDGGCGTENNPVLIGLTEANMEGWLGNEPVHVLSIGCGYSDDDMPWEKAQKSNNISEVMYFADPQDGGLARRQASEEKVSFCNSMMGAIPGFTFQHVDYPLLKAQDAMDRVDLIPFYRMAGMEVGKKIDPRPFID